MRSFRHGRRAATIFALLLLSPTPVAFAQGVPGNAPGSQTGDTGSAFNGLASAPEANLFTGVAQTSIPIQVPPGRLGLAPVLALSYSSAAGASPYGFGWSLPIARIHRSTRHGVPHYDNSDEFVLEMPGSLLELEPVPNSASAYRAQIESGFLRIGFDRSRNYWKVIDRLGVTFLFGMLPMTRTGRGTTRDQTFAWLLERIEDPAGNRIDFAYRAGADAVTSSGLPDVIRYGASARTGLAHFAEVRFEWTAVAHPGRVSWRDGYEDRLDVRLSAITTRTHDLDARRYDFSFEEDATTADLRLVAATLTGFAESPSDDVQLPSTVFVYAPALHDGWPALGSPADGAEPYEIPMAGHLRLGHNDVSADSVDLNGDSKIDRIDISQRPPKVWLGDGHSFTLVGSWNWPTGSTVPRVIRKSDGSGNLLSNVFDLDGDSLADLVDSNPAACASTAGYWCVWRGTTSGFASTPTPWRAPVGKLRQTANGGSRIVIDLVDVDADGRLELLDATVHDANGGHPLWNVYRNTGDGFAVQPTPLEAPFPFLSRTSNGRTTHGLLDLNADSLPDVVIADPMNFDDTRWGRYPYWEVYFNTGNGFAAEPAQWSIDGGVGDGTGLPNFLSLHAPDGTTIADLFDLTGDGRPDLVRRTRGLEPQFSGVPKLCRAEPRCASPDIDESAVSAGYCCFNLLVFVNTGSSFSQPVGWSSPAHGLRSDFETCPYETASPCSVAYVYDFDFFDIDGDGLVEFVERHTSGGKPYSWMGGIL